MDLTFGLLRVSILILSMFTGTREVLVSNTGAGVDRPNAWEVNWTSYILLTQLIVIADCWLFYRTLENAGCVVVVHGYQVILVNDYILNLGIP